MGACGNQENQLGRVTLCDIVFHLQTLHNFWIQKRLPCSGFKAVVFPFWVLFIISSYFSSLSGRMNTKLIKLDQKK